MARFTITINATLNGKTCKNPQIEFIQGSDVIYPCEISGNQITIETLPGTNPNACIEGYIKCDDDCLNCPPQYFKKCLCNDVTLLNSCQICKDGLIEEICTPEEIAAGKICSPNGCICPPDKPITDPNTGQCVVCITGTISPTNPCQICIAGGWVIVDCGPNERCVNGECECIPPYVKDPLTGECKLKDECLDDEDCPTCKTCILGKCEPVVCPEGFQCINDECVPACTNVNCNNGADCGENCGCLDGKCVPCTILSCLDEASCQAALGCKCTGDDCVPVDNCNQNCEDNPCVDPGCTCYNGECVNCENFPCTDAEGGCNSYYNCQCNDEGKCEGGKDCEDTFELKKKEVCSADGCELEAVYNTKNKCMCDPIVFRVINSKTCFAQNPDFPDNPPSLQGNNLFEIFVEMFKRGTQYSQFKTSSVFSEDEVVTGSIKVVVNAGGVTLPTLTSTITANNTIPTIGVPIPTSFPDEKNKVVKVSVFTESIKVTDNDCINYENKEIATYEIDLNAPQSVICAKLNSYIKSQSFKLEDSTSTKKPLIVWYRTSGDDFGATRVSLTNTDYAAKGHFRRKYLTGVAGSFSDKISKPEEGLLNNFRYKTTIDCGCEGANVATTGDVVIYCCPKDWTIVPDGNSCGKKVTIKAFTNCSVNNPFLDSAKYPSQSITTYFISINGKAPKKLDVYPNEDIVLTETEPIKSLAFYQGYAGSTSKPPVVTKACEKSYNFNPVLPDFTVNTSLACTDGVITVEVPSTGPAASSVTLKLETYLNTLNLKPTSNPRIFTTVNSGPNGAGSNAEIATEIKKSNTAKVTVNFVGGCTNTKEIPYTCAGRIDTEAEPTTYARGTCPGGGDNPKIVVTPSGFGDNVVYSLNGGAFQTSNEFLNVPAGVYTVTAKETINGVESIATSTITIEAPIVPTVSLSPASICVGGSSTLTITGAIGSVFKVYSPSNLLLSTVTVGNTGSVTVPGLTAPGNYTVTLDPGAPDKSCSPFSQTVNLSVGGTQLTPQIEIQPGTYCVGQPVPFRIVDGGANATYNVSSLGTGTVTSPLQANQFAYNGVFTPSTTTGFIQITGVDGTCNTTTNPQITVSTTQGPVVTSATAICQVNNQHTVTVVATGATGVTIGGVAATNTSPNTWQRTNITGLTEADIVVTNGSCNITQTVQLQNCLCPTGSVFVTTGGDTCGQGLTTIDYNGVSGITPNSSWTYVFQNFALGDWGNVGVSATFNPLSTPSLSVPTTVGVIDTYRLKLVNTTNGCEYFSDSVTVTAVQPPLNVTITPSIPSPALTGQTVTFSTVQGDYTYTWSGAVNGSTYQSNPITFTTPGTYTINVQVCSTPGCCVTQTISYVVGQNCTNPPIVTAPTPVYTNSCANIQVNHQLGSGTGAITYTVASTYVNVSSTAVPPNGIIIVPTSAVPAGVTDNFTITLTDSNGCTGSVAVTYERSTYVNTGTADFTPVLTPTTKFLRVHAVTAYTCANSTVTGGTGAQSIYNVDQFDWSSGYALYDDTSGCTGTLATTGNATDLVTLINNFLSTNGYSGSVSWDAVNNDMTYTISDNTNEIERISITYTTHTASQCSGFTISGTRAMTVDLPCQCP